MEREKFNQKILEDKKDIESWLHQADPSLTVHDLPNEPQISFRKNVLLNENEPDKKKQNSVRVVFSWDYQQNCKIVL